MGFYRRRIADGWLLGYFGEAPEAVEGVELVAAEFSEYEALAKPQSQIDSDKDELIAALKAKANELINENTVEAIRFRAEIQLHKDEINILRQAVTTLTAAFDYLRTNGQSVMLTANAVHGMFASIPSTPTLDNRTNSDIKTGYENKIAADLGNLD